MKTTGPDQLTLVTLEVEQLPPEAAAEVPPFAPPSVDPEDPTDIASQVTQKSLAIVDTAAPPEDSNPAIFRLFCQLPDALKGVLLECILSGNVRKAFELDREERLSLASFLRQVVGGDADLKMKDNGSWTQDELIKCNLVCIGGRELRILDESGIKIATGDPNTEIQQKLLRSRCDAHLREILLFTANRLEKDHYEMTYSEALATFRVHWSALPPQLQAKIPLSALENDLYNPVHLAKINGLTVPQLLGPTPDGKAVIFSDHRAVSFAEPTSYMAALAIVKGAGYKLFPSGLKEKDLDRIMRCEDFIMIGSLLESIKRPGRPSYEQELYEQRTGKNFPGSNATWVYSGSNPSYPLKMSHGKMHAFLGPAIPDGDAGALRMYLMTI